MPHADPDSPRLRPALAGLSLAMLLAAVPVAADEPAFAATPFDMLPGPGDTVDLAPVPALRWPLGPDGLVLRLRGGAEGHGPASVGLAFHVGEGVSLGAAGALDPGSGEVAAVVSLEIGL